VKVSEPTTIQGSRHTQIAPRRRCCGGGAAHTASASSSHAGTGHPSATVNKRRIDARASSTERMTVTQTGIPAARSRSTSSWRFSSWLASTRSGFSAMMAATFGFLVPRILGTSRPAGWVHHWVAPTSDSGRVTATDSVSEGTRETTRATGRRTGTGKRRSSRGNSSVPVT
jgi:hypothetical protein